jgi:hypothetical protein
MRSADIGAGVARKFSSTVARAFNKVRTGDGRQALQVVHGEGEWLINQTVDEETMLSRIDDRNTRVVPLKVE